jgi:hypothetical protein
MTKNWLICIDDTDDIGTKGTGEIAEEIMQLISINQYEPQEINSERLINSSSWVTRHQLFVHPDIPYTSHNSAMCFEISSALTLPQIKQICVDHLLAESALAADPGLAIIEKNKLSKDHCLQLIMFGQQAKKEIKTKLDAYQLASDIGIDLSEHGGTGQGVIGAIAGMGLRISGNDGRVKGQITLGLSETTPSIMLSVRQIKKITGLNAVMDLSGSMLSDLETVNVTGKVKAVLQSHLFSLLVYQYCNESTGKLCWCNALKQQLKNY